MTRAERQSLDRIAAGFLPMKTNNPTCRAVVRKLEREGLCKWSPKGWSLTESGWAAVS